MKVQIHYEEPDDRTGVINYLTGDNADASHSTKHNALLQKAATMAGAWHEVFPDTKFKVVEVPK